MAMSSLLYLAVGASATLRVPIHAHDLTLVDAARGGRAAAPGLWTLRASVAGRERDVRVRLRVR